MKNIVKNMAFAVVAFSIPSFALAQDLTLEELAKYDGKNGNKAYVAVDNVIYDVTNVNNNKKAWKDGKHAYGKVLAGTDVSEHIDNAPHGREKLKTLPVVGKLVK